jgi:TonB family protein
MRGFFLLSFLLITLAGLVSAQEPATVDLGLAPTQPAADKINPPVMLNEVGALYPKPAQHKHISGLCVVSLKVDVNGMPQEIKLVRCSDPIFEKNSLKAVEQYRFKPATTQDGTPVAVRISVEISFHLNGGKIPQKKIHYTFSAPPDLTSAEPGANGVYPLSAKATPPVITKFYGENRWNATYPINRTSSCDAVLTISAKGKVSDLQIIRCERPELNILARQSLLNSHYKPGSVDGKDVAIQASVHIGVGDSAANSE